MNEIINAVLRHFLHYFGHITATAHIFMNICEARQCSCHVILANLLDKNDNTSGLQKGYKYST